MLPYKYLPSNIKEVITDIDCLKNVLVLYNRPNSKLLTAR